MSTVPEKPHYISEQLMPVGDYVLGVAIARLGWEKEHGDEFSLMKEADHLWKMANVLNRLGIMANYGDKSAAHFNLAIMNELGRISRYIEHVTGRNPLDEKWEAW